MEGEHVFVNHHGRLLFQLPNPSKTTCSDPSDWVHHDDIDMDMDEDDFSPQGGHAGGREGAAECSGFASSEEMLEPPYLGVAVPQALGALRKPISTNIWMTTSLAST